MSRNSFKRTTECSTKPFFMEVPVLERIRIHDNGIDHAKHDCPLHDTLANERDMGFLAFQSQHRVHADICG